MGCKLFFRGVPPEGGGGGYEKICANFFHPPAWESCTLSFSYVLCLVDPPTGSCRSTKGSARRAMQAVLPLYPSLSRLHLLHLCLGGVSCGYTQVLLGGHRHPPAMLVEPPWGRHARHGFLRRGLRGSYTFGYALVFCCSPSYWWRPSTCLPFFPSFFFSFFLRLLRQAEGTFSLKAERTLWKMEGGGGCDFLRMSFLRRACSRILIFVEVSLLL